MNKAVVAVLALLVSMTSAGAQVPPSPSEIAAYRGLHAAAASGNSAEIGTLMKAGAGAETRDAGGRTPFLVAAHLRQRDAMKALVAAGAYANAADDQRYDAVTIASVAGDVETLETALALGNRATNVTSTYDGTALIAAAHLGHDEVVRVLIKAGAPLDHVNNLGWTALIEAVVLGDGGNRHTETVRALVSAGADTSIADRSGQTPLDLARARGYAGMVKLLGG
ncbi:MAG: ankyrin repeat domain-containing protein [Rhizobiales bacterium]|nr:ankyrin repeat domain-containing protein [Hyphomicrobiales bacterium]